MAVKPERNTQTDRKIYFPHTLNRVRVESEREAGNLAAVRFKQIQD